MSNTTSTQDPVIQNLAQGVKLIGEAWVAGNAVATMNAARTRPFKDTQRVGGVFPDPMPYNRAEQITFLTGQIGLNYLLVHFIFAPLLAIYAVIMAAPPVALLLYARHHAAVAALTTPFGIVWGIFALILLYLLGRKLTRAIYGRKVKRSVGSVPQAPALAAPRLLQPPTQPPSDRTPLGYWDT